MPSKLWNERGLWSAIERYREQNKALGVKGRCYEKALLRSFEIQKRGLEVKVAKGYYKGEYHAWVEIRDPKTDVWYVDDPSQDIKYQYGYTLEALKDYKGPFSYETPQWEITDEGSKKVYAEQGKKKRV